MRNISIIGLGYVGLPLAVAFGKLGHTIGFDIDSQRIGELKSDLDKTGEVSKEELAASDVFFTDQIDDLRKSNFFIVAVPTPVNQANQPDLSILLKATEIVGQVLKPGDIVVFESTVYPGATEEECGPVLEKVSHLKAGHDFKLGYSPERINPGDKEHTLANIKKVVSAQDNETLDEISQIYCSVVKVGVFKAQSIKIAEAAKVIENSQRDLNIAFMNELAMIFDKMGIDTLSVLEAAGSKWNFLPFKPGLVGGHCIGVDPYYLTYKSQELGYHPQVILAGRKINDGMGKYIAENTIKKMIQTGQRILDSTVTILGITFKENCPDIRNSKVIDIIKNLESYGVNVQIHDPLADFENTYKEYGVKLKKLEELEPADGLVLAVAHDDFQNMSGEDIKKLVGEDSTLIDVKGVIDPAIVESQDIAYWQL